MKVPEPKKFAGGYKLQLRLGGVSKMIYGATAKDCKREAEAIKAAFLAGKLPIEQRTDKSLSDMIKAYCEAKNNVLSPSTLRGYEIIRRNRFKSVMDKPAASVKNWQAVVNEEAGLVSAKTVKGSWGLAKTVLMQNGINPGNVTLPQVVEKDEPWLTPEEIKVFLKAIEGSSFEYAALLALHSLRRSEIMAVAQTAGSIDAKKKVIHVRGAVVPNADHKFVLKETNKNTTSRRDIPFMIPRIEELAASGAPISEGSPNTLTHRINRVCAENGLPEVGAHGLRRSFASLAYHLGWPERYTMKIGGWADAKTMHKIYIKLSAADEAEQVKSMSDFYSTNSVANP